MTHAYSCNYHFLWPGCISMRSRSDCFQMLVCKKFWYAKHGSMYRPFLVFFQLTQLQESTYFHLSTVQGQVGCACHSIPYTILRDCTFEEKLPSTTCFLEVKRASSMQYILNSQPASPFSVATFLLLNFNV